MGYDHGKRRHGKFSIDKHINYIFNKTLITLLSLSLQLDKDSKLILQLQTADRIIGRSELFMTTVLQILWIIMVNRIQFPV